MLKTELAILCMECKQLPDVTSAKPHSTSRPNIAFIRSAGERLWSESIPSIRMYRVLALLIPIAVNYWSKGICNKHIKSLRSDRQCKMA
jgi:hypothetical protein